MKLRERIALVTGAGSGIGRAIALLFAEEGASVIVNDLTLEAAQKTVDEMGASKSRGHALAADVADSAQVKAMFAEVEHRCGRLESDKWDEMNRKGEARLREMMSGQPIHTHWDFTQEMTDEQWHRMIGVHLNGTFFCTREALKLMSRPRSDGSTRGVIVNMSSLQR